MNIARAVSTVVLGLGCGLAGLAQAAPLSFPGTNTGAIPDNNPAGLTVAFAASGITLPVGKVTLSLTMTHTWVGDLRVVLTSPAGAARMVVFSRIGTSRTLTTGDSSNLSGAYLFTDAPVAGGLWAAAAVVDDTQLIPSGSYLPSSSGAPGRSDAGGCATSLTGVFEGLTPAQANGSWTVSLVDQFATDTGAITAALLTIDQQDTIFMHGFEALAVNNSIDDSPEGGVPDRCINKVQADFTGDGLTDYVTARVLGPDIEWTVRENLGPGAGSPATGAAGPPTTFVLGTAATDFIDSLDYDGDRIADATVWTPATGTFQIRLSSRLGGDSVIAINLGQNGDNPVQSGDYNSDFRDDLAVYRAPPFSGPDGPTFMLIRNSANGQVRSVPLGIGVDGDEFVIGGFDINGDARADIMVQRSDPMIAGGALFTQYNGVSGGVLSSYAFGRDSDFIIPGNHVGNFLFDTTVSRSETIMGVPGRSWYIRDSFNGAELPVIRFGITNDFRIGGDYDGDGLSDVANWRPNADPALCQFLIQPSLVPANTWTIVQGVQTAFPVAASRVH